MVSRSEVRRKIGEFLRQPAERLDDSAVLTDLVSDSMILVNMVVELQEDLRVRLVHDDIKSVRTVGDLLTVFEAKSQG
jgi:acyl carrier protein